MGADLRAAFVASCLRGALPPVDLRAVCFVRAIAEIQECRWWWYAVVCGGRCHLMNVCEECVGEDKSVGVIDKTSKQSTGD